VTVRLVHEVWRADGREDHPICVRSFFGPTEEAVYAQFLAHEFSDCRGGDGRTPVETRVSTGWVRAVVRWAFYHPGESVPTTHPSQAVAQAARPVSMPVPAWTPPQAAPQAARAPFIPRVIPGGRTTNVMATGEVADLSASGGKDFCSLDDAKTGR